MHLYAYSKFIKASLMPGLHPIPISLLANRIGLFPNKFSKPLGSYPTEPFPFFQQVSGLHF
jgi:hypothetical protein